MNYTKWVNGWGLGVAHPPLAEAQWARDMTVRYTLLNSLDAGAVRLHFTNRFGEHPARLAHVTVAVSADGKESFRPDTVRDVTFGGSLSGEMAPHGDLVSDEIPFEIRAGEALTVSLYFDDFTQLDTGFTYENVHMHRRFEAGDKTRTPVLDPMRRSFSTAYNFLWSVDFLTYPDAYAVAAYGDSITSQEWVDFLAMKLAKTGGGKRAVVRRAVSGSRIFGSYPALSYFHYGEDGFTRFEREVLHDGIEAVIILHGINDIIHPDGKNPMRPMSSLPSPERLAEGLSWYVGRAQAHGLRTYLATLLPIEGWRTYDVPRDDVRIAVNEWIRVQTLTDGVIDFERAVRDEKNPRAFDAACDRGDHLHASVEGYRRMAEAVDLGIFR